MNVWLTGGAMRDTLRGARIVDLDFTVEREALKAGESLAAALGGKILEQDSLKRWVELELPGGVRASVSNARTEKYSKPGGKPQISAATIHDDLLRRDFTINAMALSLNRGSRGLLVDPTNGQADLENRELRATNPYIFFDDPVAYLPSDPISACSRFLDRSPGAVAARKCADGGISESGAGIGSCGGNSGSFEKRKCRRRSGGFRPVWTAEIDLARAYRSRAQCGRTRASRATCAHGPAGGDERGMAGVPDRTHGEAHREGQGRAAADSQSAGPAKPRNWQSSKRRRKSSRQRLNRLALPGRRTYMKLCIGRAPTRCSWCCMNPGSASCRIESALTSRNICRCRRKLPKSRWPRPG